MTFQEIRSRTPGLRAIPLETVLQRGGAMRDLSDKAKWHTRQGALSVNGAKFMNWRQGIGGGGAIDLVMHLEQVDFKAAVEWLWLRFPCTQGEAPTDLTATSSLRLPPKNAGTLPTVTHYLIHQRRIPGDIIQSLIDSGTLYADRGGNAVFLLLGDQGAPVGAELRGTCRPWRGMAPGSRKDRGYFRISTPHPSAIVLCESAIDAISCFALDTRRLCISTAGARPSPAWLPSLLRQGHPLYCGFDADPAGDTIADAMIAHHPAVIRLRPSRHDWNDILQSQQ